MASTEQARYRDNTHWRPERNCPCFKKGHARRSNHTSAQLLKGDIRTAAQAHIATVRQANFAEVQLAIFSID